MQGWIFGLSLQVPYIGIQRRMNDELASQDSTLDTPSTKTVYNTLATMRSRIYLHYLQLLILDKAPVLNSLKSVQPIIGTADVAKRRCKQSYTLQLANWLGNGHQRACSVTTSNCRIRKFTLSYLLCTARLNLKIRTRRRWFYFCCPFSYKAVLGVVVSKRCIVAFIKRKLKQTNPNITGQ